MGLPIKLALPAHFLEEEVQCGYRVTQKRKKIWAVELDLLNELLLVCKKHDIQLIVFGGTLLGAVRHSGFIPWDDDLDVALTRTEFDKLCKVAEFEFQHPYFFQTALTDRKYFFSYARLRNSETTAVIKGNETRGYNNGIYIDIYVLEGYTDSKIGFIVQRMLQKLTLKPLTMYYRKDPKDDSFKEFIFRLTRPFFMMFRYETLFGIYKRVLCLFTKSALRIGLRDEMTLQAEKYWVYKTELQDLTTLQFASLKVPVPKSYHEVLKRLYGDYMDYPPVEELGKWHENQIHFDPDIPYTEYLEHIILTPSCKDVLSGV